MEIEDFLNAIDKNKVHVSELEGLRSKNNKPRKLLSDAPPCLRHLFRDGPSGEERNKNCLCLVCSVQRNVGQLESGDGDHEPTVVFSTADAEKFWHCRKV